MFTDIRQLMMVIKLVMKLGSETRSKSKACDFPIYNTPIPPPW